MLEKVLLDAINGGKPISAANPLQTFDANLTNAIIVHQGITTAPGLAGGLSIIDAGLAGFGVNTYYGFIVQIYYDDTTKTDAQVETVFNNATGEITVGTGFKGGVVPAGVKYQVLLSNVMIKQILDIVSSIAGGSYWNSFGPNTVQVGNAVTQGVTVYDPAGGIIPAAGITPGTYTVNRIRVAVNTLVVGATPSSKVDGSVYNSYNYPIADWAIGDISLVTFSGIIIVIGGISTSLPPIQVYSRITIEPDISTTVTTINTVQGAMADAATADTLVDITTTSTESKLRRLLLRLAPGAFTSTIQGVARTDVNATLGALATYVSAAGAAFSQTINPGSAARTNIEQVLKDLSDIMAGAGITTYPAAAVPGNGVSMAAVIRTIYGQIVAIEQVKTTTIDLNQAVGTYTLFTGTAQAVHLEKLVIQMPNDIASIATLTGITVQTNDATPQVLITGAQGLVGNMTAENQFSWEGVCRINVGKLIQLTILGGAEGAAYVCNVSVQYRAVVVGGSLA